MSAAKAFLFVRADGVIAQEVVESFSLTLEYVSTKAVKKLASEAKGALAGYADQF